MKIKCVLCDYKFRKDDTEQFLDHCNTHQISSNREFVYTASCLKTEGLDQTMKFMVTTACSSSDKFDEKNVKEIITIEDSVEEPERKTVATGDFNKNDKLNEDTIEVEVDVVPCQPMNKIILTNNIKDKDSNTENFVRIEHEPRRDDVSGGFSLPRKRGRPRKNLVDPGDPDYHYTGSPLQRRPRIKPWSCSCDVEPGSVYLWKKHLKQFHADEKPDSPAVKRNTCSQCNKVFESEGLLARHVAWNHPSPRDAPSTLTVKNFPSNSSGITNRASPTSTRQDDRSSEQRGDAEQEIGKEGIDLLFAKFVDEAE